MKNENLRQPQRKSQTSQSSSLDILLFQWPRLHRWFASKVSFLRLLQMINCVLFCGDGDLGRY